jgi:septum formation protein
MKRFNHFLQDYRIFLASRSPRRYSLLTQAGIPIEVWLKEEIAENYPPDLTPLEIAVYLSRLKAQVYVNELISKDVLITADTLVVLGSRILGKPVDRADAIGMLTDLSGRPHEVITGVSLTSSSDELSFTATTTVWFEDLRPSEIEEYVDEFSPFDKAGSYGIQEWIGYMGIHRIEGSYFNVMGLPIHKLYKALQDFTGYTSIANQ